MSGPSLLRVSRWCERMGISTACGYNYLNAGLVATITVGGVRQIVESWGSNPPPRTGRAPSFEELICEGALAPRRPAKPMPEGRHTGRPPRQRPSVE